MIKEICRRCGMSEVGGGPFGVPTAVVADMQIEQDGEKKYLTVCWVDEAPDIMSYEVSGLELFPFYIDLDYEDEEGDITVDDAKGSVTETYFDDDVNSCEYSKYFRMLSSMVKKKLEEENLLLDDEDYKDEDEINNLLF